MPLEQSIEELLQEDMKNAMKSHDQTRLDAIRFILAAIKREEIDRRSAENPKPELTEQQIFSVLEKLIKQHQDAIIQYQKGNRLDLVKKEQYELSLLESYMPKSLSLEELADLVQQAITEIKASSIKDMGRVIQYVKEHATGRIDMQLVSQKIKSLLTH